MARPKNIVGQVFGKLAVLSEAEAIPAQGRSKRVRRWLCRCECGKEVVVRHNSLHTRKGCGFCVNERHKGSSFPEYWVWVAMIERCTNPNHPSYKNYGGRGISVCKRWLDLFSAFLADMGRRPSPEYSIDRSNNDGNYEPGNCRWATRDEQNRNNRHTRMFTHDGITLCLKDWARRSGVPYKTLMYRVDAGLPLEVALMFPKWKHHHPRTSQ